MAINGSSAVSTVELYSQVAKLVDAMATQKCGIHTLQVRFLP